MNLSVRKKVSQRVSVRANDRDGGMCHHWVEPTREQQVWEAGGRWAAGLLAPRKADSFVIDVRP